MVLLKDQQKYIVTLQSILNKYSLIHIALVRLVENIYSYIIL